MNAPTNFAEFFKNMSSDQKKMFKKALKIQEDEKVTVKKEGIKVKDKFDRWGMMVGKTIEYTKRGVKKTVTVKKERMSIRELDEMVKAEVSIIRRKHNIPEVV